MDTTEQENQRHLFATKIINFPVTAQEIIQDKARIAFAAFDREEYVQKILSSPEYILEVESLSRLLAYANINQADLEKLQNGILSAISALTKFAFGAGLDCCVEIMKIETAHEFETEYKPPKLSLIVPNDSRVLDKAKEDG